MQTITDAPGMLMTMDSNDGQNGTLDEAFETLRDELSRGLLYTHGRANANTTKLLEVASFSYALMELLIERGLLTVEELDERKSQMVERLAPKFVEKGMGVALTEGDQDKRSYEGQVAINCSDRLPLCQAACCRLQFALTAQDLEEGTVKWDLARPYMIRRSADGYCHHLDRCTKGCSIYDDRPIVCRGYDCRNDKRIWEDFDNYVVSPELEKLFPDECDAPNEASSEA
jgi:Fe-S-cluster containining protein